MSKILRLKAFLIFIVFLVSSSVLMSCGKLRLSPASDNSIKSGDVSESPATTDEGLPSPAVSPGEPSPTETPVAAPVDTPARTATPEEEISTFVQDFGLKLKNFSLLEPKDLLEKSMKENYGAYVSQELLTKWLDDPESAPGRLVSSPWPDRIEINGIEKLSETSYEVNGEIIELTSDEAAHGGISARRQITLTVEKVGGKWVITDAALAKAYDEIVRNTQYGFDFSLPASWKGYSIINDTWQGLAVGGDQEGTVTQTGPIISIRHPDWTEQNPRQDIPIMVFTIDQWNFLQNGDFHIGAAPIGPSELGRNSKYVFALPARYNYAFPAGYEEVEKILSGKPLVPVEPKPDQG